MSHNSIKIGNASPNVSGEISASISDLSDVTGTPTDGQYLAYDAASSEWQPTTDTNVSNTVEYFVFGRGESEGYSDSPQTASNISSGSTLFCYDTAPYNGIAGATYSSTTSTGSGGGEWLNSVTLPAGTYRINCSFLPSFSQSGYFTYAVRISGGVLVTSRAGVGTSASLLAAGGGTSSGIITFTGSTTIHPYVVSLSGLDSVANLGDSMSTSGVLLIERLA
jgi:hypothetical protein